MVETRTNGGFPLNRIDFIFNEQIADWSVTIEDIQSFQGPFGNNLLDEIQNVSVSNEWIYDDETETGYYGAVVSVYFNDQSAEGVYEMTLGPDVQDYAGNSMLEAYTARVGELGDLQVTDIQLRDPNTGDIVTSATLNSYIYVDWTVLNSGSFTLDPYGYGWSDRVWLSTDAMLDLNDIYLSDYYHYGPLAGGESYGQSYVYVSFPYYNIPGPGTYYLIVEADTYDDQAESDEGNNWLVTPIELSYPATPDFTVSDVVVTPATQEQGENITVEWTLHNQGTADYNSYLYTGIFLSDDAVWDASDANISTTYDYPNVGAGQSRAMSRTVSLPNTVSGEKFVIVVEDYYNNVYEGPGEPPS